MDAAELRESCRRFRRKSDSRLTTDDELVSRIEGEVEAFREQYFDGIGDPPQLPPEPLRELLPLMGWLIYEASWQAVRGIQSSFVSTPSGSTRAKSESSYGYVTRLADAARRLVWPEFAPRALGAIRAQALAESKRDTEVGYDLARNYHLEAKDRYESYLACHAGAPPDDPFVTALDEVLLQLDLAETGTACRTAERMITKWAEEFTLDTRGEEERLVQRIYRDVAEGVDIGVRALATADRIRTTHGLVREVTAERLALVTGYRNPGIMCGRAALIALALCPAMEDLGRLPGEGRSWAEQRAVLIMQFVEAYRVVDEPVYGPDGDPVPWDDHERPLVQQRLNFALLVPGASLPSRATFAPCLELNPLDDTAVEALSQWLAPAARQSDWARGNMIGGATLPLFIQSVMALRSLYGDERGYLDWRRQHFELGRYANQEGREDPVGAAIREAESRPLLRISRE